MVICGLFSILIAADLLAAPSSPLAEAAQRKDFHDVRALLQQSVDVNGPQVDGMTALHWAVHWNDSRITKQLIDAGANVNATNRYGVMPLSLACTNGNAAIVSMLLDAGADPNASLRGGETVLMTASRTGKLGPVKALLKRGAEVDARERKGQTALMWAAADGHLAVVDALLDAGADFRTPLPSGFTPLFFAAREGRTDVVLRLLEAGIDVNEAMRPEKGASQSRWRGTSPLMLAVENGHFELAATLLEAGADSNDRRLGYTALHAITWVRKPIRGDGDPPPAGSGEMNSLEMVRRLVAHGANVNARHKRHRPGRGRLSRTDATPFLLASKTGDVPLLRLLIDLGADPFATNADGCTPLMAAAGVGVIGDGDEAAATESEALETVKLLLELGADINAIDKNGETAMHGAAYKSRAKLVIFLADRGADIRVWNQKNRHGWTPLLIAQGHRPGNFRPSPETIVALSKLMREAGIEVSAK